MVSLIVTPTISLVISGAVRALAAAKYEKLHDRPTWIFNGTALAVSFAVKCYFEWSRKNEKLKEKREYSVMLISQLGGLLAGTFALIYFKQTLTWDERLSYTFAAGGVPDMAVIGMRFS